MKDIDPRLEVINDTGHIGNFDSAGKLKKCLCEGLSLYQMVFSIRRSFWDKKTVTVGYSNRCHCNQYKPADIGWPTGNEKKLSCSQAQLGQATCLAVA